MKFLVLILLFISLKGFSQDWEYLQADSVYKKNRVKTRTVRFYGHEGSRIVFSFDTNGRLIDRVQYNSTGKKLYNRNQYHYNEKGKLATVTYVVYWHLEDNRIVEDSLPQPSSHWSTGIYTYDPLNRLVRSVFTEPTGRVTSQNTYTYNPLALHSKMLRSSDSSIITVTILYDAPGVVKAYNSYTEKAGNVVHAWAELYENNFDAQGRILKRKKTTPGDPGWGMEYIYEYDSKGLLMTRNARRTDSKEYPSHQELVYEYTYWEKNCVQTIVKGN